MKKLLISSMVCLAFLLSYSHPLMAMDPLDSSERKTPSYQSNHQKKKARKQAFRDARNARKAGLKQHKRIITRAAGIIQAHPIVATDENSCSAQAPFLSNRSPSSRQLAVEEGPRQRGGNSRCVFKLMVFLIKKDPISLQEDQRQTNLVRSILALEKAKYLRLPAVALAWLYWRSGADHEDVKNFSLYCRRTAQDLKTEDSSIVEDVEKMLGCYRQIDRGERKDERYSPAIMEYFCEEIERQFFLFL